MNHLNNCFHRWHCASGTRKDYLLLCSNGIPLQDFNWLKLRCWNKVAYRDPENGSLAIDQGLVYMPHKHSWGKFNVPFLFNRWLDNQCRTACFDLQQLQLCILFTGHGSMAHNKSEWTIDHWLIKSHRHSLASPWPPSPLVWPPRNPARLGSR